MSGAESPLDLGTLPDFSRIWSDDEEAPLSPDGPDASGEIGIRTVSGPSAEAALRHTNIDKAWQQHDVSGEGIVIAVIDSGCDPANPGLHPRVLPGKVFVPGEADTDTQDKFGHGTCVAGLIAAEGGQGVAPDAQILPIKIYRDAADREEVMSRLADALEHVIDQDAVSVVNISLGNTGNHVSDSNLPEALTAVATRISDAVRHLRQKHVPVVAAAGNGYATFNSAVGMCFPAILPNIISVGAVHSNREVRNFTYPYGNAITRQSSIDVFAPFSQRLPRTVGAGFTRLAAPGAPVRVFGPDGRSREENGTSLSAPLVAGVIALMQQLHKRRFGQHPTCSEIEDWLAAGAHKITDALGEHVSVRNTGASFNRLDALGALNQIPNPDQPSS